jgi:hypothetical protein
MAPSETSYRLIPLNHGQSALVDEADYFVLSAHRWSALWSKSTQSYYAVRSSREGGKPMTFTMARVILGLRHGDKREADHRNCNTLDNRRENLRPCSHSENQMNRRKSPRCASPVKGVRFERNGRFRARITVDGIQHDLGCTDTLAEAIALREEGARTHHGGFAHSG